MFDRTRINLRAVLLIVATTLCACPMTGALGAPDPVLMFTDCNGNGIDDATDIAGATSEDCNTNAIPDECDIAAGTSADSNVDGIPDECPRTLHVPAEYATIQAAIDAALPGETVLLAPGTYTGSGNKDLTFGGKDITLRSEAGAANTIIDCQRNGRGFVFQNGESAAAILEGVTIHRGSVSSFGSGVLFSGAVSPTVRNCVIEESRANAIGGQMPGGGMACRNGASPTLTGCVIRDNWVQDCGICEPGYPGGWGLGGGAYVSSGSHPVFIDCAFEDNWAQGSGGSLATGKGGAVFGETGGSSVFVNCTFSGNSAEALYTGEDDGAWGGAVCGYDLEFVNCLFVGNSVSGDTQRGAAVYQAGGQLELINCTATENGAASAAIEAGALYARNCIVWNEPGAAIVAGSADIRYSDIKGGWPGTGNRNTNPLFVSPATGDYRLSSWSTLIDAGDSDAVPVGEYEAASRALNHVPRFLDNVGVVDTGVGSYPIVDMGAYENQDDPGHDCNGNGIDDATDIAGATSDDCNTNAIPDECDIAAGTSADVNSDGVPDECALVRRVPSVYPTIQAAIDASVDGDIVLVADGSYTGVGNRNIDFGGRAIVLRSESGPDSCTIDAQNDARCFVFQSGEPVSAVVRGFTVKRGREMVDGYFDGGVARGGGMLVTNGSSPTVRDCRFSDCMARAYGTDFGVSAYGGAAACIDGSSPVFVQCRFSGNKAWASCDGIASGIAGGGAVYGSADSYPQFANCVFDDNQASGSGEYAGSTGGALRISNATIVNCLVARNRAEALGFYGAGAGGGGISQSSGQLAVEQCTVAQNVAYLSVYYDDPIPTPIGGGVAAVNGSFRNNVVWGNSVERFVGTFGPLEVWSSQVYVNQGPVDVGFSDLEGGLAAIEGAGTVVDGGGNVDRDPDFIDPAGGDFALGMHSGAIDSGDNTVVPPDEFDLDHDGDVVEPWPVDITGNSRFSDNADVPDAGEGSPPIVDMGAYENQDDPVIDCNGNGVPDVDDIAGGTSEDCDSDGVPDECGGPFIDCNTNGINDVCEREGNDCDNNGTLDECELGSRDCNGNGVVDDCDPAGDFNGDGYVDEADMDGFLACLTAPCVTPACLPALYGDACCDLADADDDGDVDLRDFAVWQAMFGKVCVSNADCDDGLFCTGDGLCIEGRCQPGANPCTDPAFPQCDELNDVCVECLVDGDCDDGLFCTGAETCVSSACYSDGDPCSGDPEYPYCNETADTCVECLADGDCDDGLFCTGVETCVGSACVAGSNPCTDPALPHCDESAEVCVCQSDGECDDGLFCTGEETCVGGGCQSAGDPCNGDPQAPHCDEDGDVCVECVPEAVPLTWWSSRTDSVNVLLISSQDLRLGDAKTGYLEGEMALPAWGTWTLAFVIDPDNDADADRNDYVDFFIDGVFKARYFNGPTIAAYWVESEFEGDLLTYRFEFVSSKATVGKHVIVRTGTATGLGGECDDGLFCTGDETCESGVCVSSGSPCTDPDFPICDEDGDTCVVCTGDGDCDDGLFCTGVETCVGGACIAGTDPCIDPSYPICDEVLDICTAGAAYVEDFESYVCGGEPVDWYDTEAGGSLVHNDVLFDVACLGDTQAFHTASTATNIHSHYVGPGSDTWTNYTFGGRMRISASTGGTGVTFLSQYPGETLYYRLRRYQWGTTFHISPSDGVTVPLGTLDTGVSPVAGVWYRFLIDVTDTGTQTEIRAKVWEDGAQEPANWQADCYDDTATRLTSGTIGAWSMGAGDKYWDDLTVETAAP